MIRRRNRPFKQSYVDVSVLNEICQCRQELFYGFFGWWWLFASTQIHNHPRDVAQKRHGYFRSDEQQKRFDHTESNHQISTIRSVAYFIFCYFVLFKFFSRKIKEIKKKEKYTNNISECPHCLFAHVLMR